MSRFRFSIRAFLVVVTLLGCGLAAMVSQSPLATSLAYTAFLVLLCLALAGAILSTPNRAFWLGFAIFGWTYWFVEFDASQSDRQPAGIPITYLTRTLTRPPISLQEPLQSSAPAGLLTRELMELLESSMTGSRSVGSKVIAQWRGGTYYSGTITDAKAGQYLIVWDDGSAPQWTPASQILPNSPNLRLAAHATLGGLFALAGGVLVALSFGGKPASHPACGRQSE